MIHYLEAKRHQLDPKKGYVLKMMWAELRVGVGSSKVNMDSRCFHFASFESLFLVDGQDLMDTELTDNTGSPLVFPN